MEACMNRIEDSLSRSESINDPSTQESIKGLIYFRHMLWSSSAVKQYVASVLSDLSEPKRQMLQQWIEEIPSDFKKCNLDDLSKYGIDTSSAKKNPTNTSKSFLEPSFMFEHLPSATKNPEALTESSVRKYPSTGAEIFSNEQDFLSKLCEFNVDELALYMTDVDQKILSAIASNNWPNDWFTVVKEFDPSPVYDKLKQKLKLNHARFNKTAAGGESGNHNGDYKVDDDDHDEDSDDDSASEDGNNAAQSTLDNKGDDASSEDSSASSTQETKPNWKISAKQLKRLNIDSKKINYSEVARSSDPETLVDRSTLAYDAYQQLTDYLVLLIIRTAGELQRRMVSKLIRLSHHLIYGFGNVNSACAVMQALNHDQILAISEVWEALSESDRTLFAQLDKFSYNSQTTQFQTYEELLRELTEKANLLAKKNVQFDVLPSLHLHSRWLRRLWKKVNTKVEDDKDSIKSVHKLIRQFGHISHQFKQLCLNYPSLSSRLSDRTSAIARCLGKPYEPVADSGLGKYGILSRQASQVEHFQKRSQLFGQQKLSTFPRKASTAYYAPVVDEENPVQITTPAVESYLEGVAEYLNTYRDALEAQKEMRQRLQKDDLSEEEINAFVQHIDEQGDYICIYHQRHPLEEAQREIVHRDVLYYLVDTPAELWGETEVQEWTRLNHVNDEAIDDFLSTSEGIALMDLAALMKPIKGDKVFRNGWFGSETKEQRSHRQEQQEILKNAVLQSRQKCIEQVNEKFPKMGTRKKLFRAVSLLEQFDFPFEEHHVLGAQLREVARRQFFSRQYLPPVPYQTDSEYQRQLKKFLESVKLDQYYDNVCDMDKLVLMQLTPDNAADLNIPKLGHAKKMVRSIAAMLNVNTDPSEVEFNKIDVDEFYFVSYPLSYWTHFQTLQWIKHKLTLDDPKSCEKDFRQYMVDGALLVDVSMGLSPHSLGWTFPSSLGTEDRKSIKAGVEAVQKVIQRMYM